jgi:hypothetical protein
MDESGNAFTFPFLEIVKDGFQVEVFSKTGANTVDKLYWGLDQPVWQSGETVVLLDPFGEERARFQIQ